MTSLLHKIHREAKGNSAQNVLGSERAVIEAVFSELGKIGWQSFTTTRLPLLKLPDDILEALRAGKIEYTKAKAIAKIKDEEKRKELLEVVIKNNLSLTQIKEKIKEINAEETNFSSLTDQIKSVSAKLKTCKALNDPKKKERLEKLLEKLNKDLDKLLNS